MIEKILLLFILICSMLGLDAPRLKQLAVRERVAYGAICLGAFYLAMVYVGFPDWPTPTQLVGLLVEKPSQQIFKLLDSSR